MNAGTKMAIDTLRGAISEIDEDARDVGDGHPIADALRLVEAELIRNSAEHVHTGELVEMLFSISASGPKHRVISGVRTTFASDGAAWLWPTKESGPN